MQLLIEVTDTFNIDGDDVGCFMELQMDMKLTDPATVQKNYVCRPLHAEGKADIKDLLNKDLKRRSASSYSSPLACLRKNDQRLCLCVNNLGGSSWFSVVHQGKA